MAEEELVEKYRKLASLVEELSKKYGEAGVGEEFEKKLKEIEERVDFKLKEINEKIAGIKEVPSPKKLRDELIESSKRQVEEALKKIEELPELKRLSIFESLVEKLTEKVEGMDGRIAELQKEVGRPVEEFVPEISEMRDFLASSDKIISSRTKEEVEKRLKNIFVGLAEIRKDLRALTRANEGFEKEIKVLEERSNKLREEINKIVSSSVKEEFVKNLKKNISLQLPRILEANVAEVEERLNTIIKERASKITDELQKISASFMALGVEIEKLKLSQEELRNTLPETEDKIYKKLLDSVAVEIAKKVDEEFKTYSLKVNEEYGKIDSKILALKDSLEKTTQDFLRILKKRDKLLRDKIVEKINQWLPKKIAEVERKVIKKVDERILVLEEAKERFIGELEKIGEDLESRMDKINASFSLLKDEVKEQLKENKIKEIVAGIVERDMSILGKRIEELGMAYEKISKKVDELVVLTSKLPELVEEVEK